MAEDQSIDRGELLALTAEIVAAHVGNNAVASADVAALIQSVFDTLSGLGIDEPAASVGLTPASSIASYRSERHADVAVAHFARGDSVGFPEAMVELAD
jgi:predicted transcriptional regulator